MRQENPPQKQATIYDVATAAGVAPSTVSRALSRPGRVSAVTAQKVREAAEALDYGYSARPRTADLPHRLLAIVVADIGNPVFHEVVRGAEEAAARAGYTVMLFDAQEDHRRELRAAEQFIFAVDGLLLTSPRLSDSGIRAIAKQRPVLTLNRHVRGLPGVVLDSTRGARRAVEHLAELGHTQLTYCAGPESAWSDGMRWRGVQEAAAEANLHAQRIAPGAPTLQGGEEAARRWAEAPTSAVICYNDIMALGFIRGLRHQGISTPEDVSVVGFDNSQTAQLTTPALTSVAAPLDQLGQIAAQNLIAVVQGARSSQEPLSLPTRLIIRESTGPATPATDLRRRLRA